MGLRSLVKERIKQAIGRTEPSAPAPPARAPVPPPNRPPPPPPINVQAESPPKAVVAPPPPKAEVAPTPPKVEVAPTPPKVEVAPPPPKVEVAPPPPKAEVAPAPPKAEVAPTPPKAEVAPPPPKAEVAPPPPKAEIAPPLSEAKASWASDMETADAPTRNAHYRETFQTSTQALQLKIHHPELGLITFSCEPGEYILDAADRAGHPLPFSCRSGGCLACTGLILSGTAVMGDQYVLEDEQIDAGFYLLCVTSPTSDCEIRSHQEDVVS